MLRALRNANWFLQSQREISARLVEKLLKLDRAVAERFYALYREQFNPDLTVPDGSGRRMGCRAKKTPPSPHRWSIQRLPKEPDADQ